jgi:hypothetical protein
LVGCMQVEGEGGGGVHASEEGRRLWWGACMWRGAEVVVGCMHVERGNRGSAHQKGVQGIMQQSKQVASMSWHYCLSHICGRGVGVGVVDCTRRGERGVSTGGGGGVMWRQGILQDSKKGGAVQLGITLAQAQVCNM